MITLLAMHFPISGTDISPVYLVVIGFLIGILGGFFGVGGSFIAGPALRAVGMHWNFAVGTDLAHIVGKSVVAAKRHRALGNVDLRLGFLMATGTIAGAEVGAQLIQYLKRQGNVDQVVSVISIVIYCSISAFMVVESWRTLRAEDQFDAVLYTGNGPSPRVELDPVRCGETAEFQEHMRRMAVSGIPPLETERLKKLCGL